MITRLPGASAARVEAEISKPLETRLREVPEIKHLGSSSRPGISLLSIELGDHVDASSNEAAFSRIRDKLADAEVLLPSGASKPEFDDRRGAVAYSFIAAVSWDSTDALLPGMVTRSAHMLADRLRNIAGTELVRVFGAVEEEISVIVSPARLAALGLGGADLARALEQADAKLSAGFVRPAGRVLPLEVAGELNSVARVAAVPLVAAPGGGVVRVGDVAVVEKGWRDPPRQLARADGRPAVLVAVRVDPGIRVDRWAARARAELQAFQSELGGGLVAAALFDQSGYTQDRLSALARNLGFGVLLVMVVVLLGMGWRAALIVGLALPLSGAAALFGLSLFGQQIHQMTVFGLIVAIGLLIDNAIVMTSEVHKHLARGAARRAAVSRSLRHLAGPLFASTFTTILGFMPVFLLPGNVGDFVGPIAISVVLALTASYLLSLSVIAALAGRYGVRQGAAARRWWRGGLGSAAIERRYRILLGAAMSRPILAITAVLILPLLGFTLAGSLEMQFFPSADRNQIEVEVRTERGSSLARTAAQASAVEAAIREQMPVERIDWMFGASFPTVYYNLLMDQDDDPAYAQAIVTFADAGAARTALRGLAPRLAERFPALLLVVSPFGQGPPIEAPVAMRLLGPDLDVLDRLGQDLRRAMHATPGVSASRSTISGGRAKLVFQADEDELRHLGLSLAGLARQFEANLEGRAGGLVIEDVEALPVRIRYPGERRDSVDGVTHMQIAAPLANGDLGWVPAAALGQFVLLPERDLITRRDGERVNTILGYLAPGHLPIEVSRALHERLAASGFTLPPGYRLQKGGDSEKQGEAVGQLATYVPVLLTLMIASVVLTFRSAALAAQIGLVALLSLGLGALSLKLSGYHLGFNPMIGSAGLVGVAINGSIVVLAAIRARPEARAGEPAALVDEVVGSTRHILSTSMTTVCGFLPLIYLDAGEFWPPLAVVIAGGVALSTPLALILTPALYRLVHGGRHVASSRLMRAASTAPA